MKYGSLVSLNNINSKTLLPRNISNNNQLYDKFNNSTTTTPTTTPSDIGTFSVINTNKITSNNTLTLTSTVISDPIIQYNIQGINTNNIENKYLVKVVVPALTPIFNCNFNNILYNNTSKITFNGKVATKDTNYNSAHFTFEGCTDNNNLLIYNINKLYSFDENNYKINDFYLNDLDLIIEITNNLNNDTEWIISLESICI